MNVLIVGAGYLAKYLYQDIKKDIAVKNIYTLSRTDTFLDNQKHISADLDNIDSLQKLSIIAESILTIYYLAPPKPEGLIETRVKHFIQYLQSLHKLQIKLVYISTSGVYGNKNGDWVTENTAANPETERAKRRVSAEQQLLVLNNQASNIHTIILRVPGIYGPDRLPIDKIRQRNKIICEEESGYTNLIHVKDLASCCVTAIARGKGGEIYNVSDTQPVKSSYYYKLVAQIAKISAPEEVSYQTAIETFDKKRLSFLTESRRLDITKMQTELKPKLEFVNLENGVLQALKKSLL